MLKHLAAQGVLIVENPISKDKYVFIYVEIDIKCLVQSVEIDIATLESVTFWFLHSSTIQSLRYIPMIYRYLRVVTVPSLAS